MTSTGIIGSNRFAFSIDFVLEHETEYNADGSVRVERDPHDPGGTTKYGIDQRSHPGVDVEHLTLEKARMIYFAGEWTECKCAYLAAPWDLAVFDAAVNTGSHHAILWLQESVGATVDGFIGPKTIAKTNAAQRSAFDAYIARRRHYYMTEVRSALRIRYLKGWMARVDDLRAASTFEPTDSQLA